VTASPVKLYTSEVLALATSLAAWPYDPAMPYRGEARSPACGSTLKLSCNLDANGRISALGLGAQACAIGQASAAIFAGSALGRTRTQLAQDEAAIAAWLRHEAPMPDLPGFSAIAPALDYPARHGAILLAWRAVHSALSSGETAV